MPISFLISRLSHTSVAAAHAWEWLLDAACHEIAGSAPGPSVSTWATVPQGHRSGGGATAAGMKGVLPRAPSWG